MQLEISRKTTLGIGIQVQKWPKAKHYVARAGRIESRVITMDADGPRSAFTICAFLLAGLVSAATQ